MNNNLVGIIVDAGHGGIDSGAVGNNLEEKDLTLRAAKYIYNRLTELGIPAKMTREEDIYLPKDERIKKVLSLYNNSPNTILISNHINAGGAEGAEIVYALKNNSTLSELILNNIEKEGQIKRKVYQRRLPENPNKDYYYILRETGNTEPILIEYGFIDNKKDAIKLNNEIERYAEAVVKSIAEYTGSKYFEPNNPNSDEEYIVKKNDTLYSISKKFNISVDKLKEINNLNSNNLYIGQTLKLIEKNSPNNDNYEIYTVEKGDTLYSIGRKYNISVENLKEINNLENNELYISQKIIIPVENIENDFSTYIVEKGDSLWKIAQKFNIPVNKLIEINNLDDLVIKINQKILVPKINNEIQEDTYIVKKGDTLWSISKLKDISVDKLKELNNLDSNLLSVGQILKIK